MREQGVPVDAVAVRTETPDDWALRRGVGWCLGYDAWLACEAGRAHALRIVGTPLDWLRSPGSLCVLDWEAALPLLRGLGETVTLRCNRGAGQRLEALLRRGGLPMVRETGGWPSGERRAA